MDNSILYNKQNTNQPQLHSNATIKRLLEEIKAELEFIKDQLHINGAGPCSYCGRKWFVSSQTKPVTSCAICNKTLCHTHMWPRCNNCNGSCCNN